jgi:hypothetical protein
MTRRDLNIEDIKYHSRDIFFSFFSLLSDLIWLAGLGGAFYYIFTTLLPDWHGFMKFILGLAGVIYLEIVRRKELDNFVGDLILLGVVVLTAAQYDIPLKWSWYIIVLVTTITLLHIVVRYTERKSDKNRELVKKEESSKVAEFKKKYGPKH